MIDAIPSDIGIKGIDNSFILMLAKNTKLPASATKIFTVPDRSISRITIEVVEREEEQQQGFYG